MIHLQVTNLLFDFHLGHGLILMIVVAWIN